VKTPKHSRKSNHKAPKIRASIAAGVVVILLAGRFRGKRAVCLKVLDSGLLLVSGPYKVNGVPLRRVNPVYVIATSTTVDVSSVDVYSLDDKYFAKSSNKAAKDSEEEFFAKDAPKAAIVSDQRKADQKKVDAALTKAVNGVPMLSAYLGARFTLTNNDRPHNMKF